MSDAPVPAENLDFEKGELGEVSTKVGSVGWPEGAENAQGVGPGSEESGDDEPDVPAEEPQPESPPAEGSPA